MSVAAAEIHPDPGRYVLPLPGPDTPVVLPQFVVAMHADRNARYADAAWPLAPLTANPSTGKRVLYWDNCPDGFADELRLVAWTLINGRLRPTFLLERGTRFRSRLSIHQIHATITAWMHLATWLRDRGIGRLADCDRDVWHAYGEHLSATHSGRSHLAKILAALTRLWAFDQLSSRPAGVSRPPWDQHRADDYLPARASGGENVTEPLVEATIGPLLVWAIRLVDDLAEDILAGWVETRQLADTARANTATVESAAALRALLAPRLATGEVLPTVARKLANTYLAAITGATINQVERLAQRDGLTRFAPERAGPCPLRLPVTGRIGGVPWRPFLDFAEAPVLMRHLGTAAFILCAYLTGMRIGEVLGMRAGCCPDPQPDADGSVGPYMIRSNHYKNAVDADGNHQSAGQERDVPWVAIAPVVKAIRVLERMVPDGALLFDHHAHDLRGHRPGTGSLKPAVVSRRISDFVSWANAEASAQGRPGEMIPADPHGPIGTARFRRSLAWHIARRPNGLVALAIQYGHLRTAVSGGYANRGRGGIDELLDLETARAVADTVAELRDDLDTGGGLSGPAARRVIKAATTAPQFTGTVITARTAHRLLANQDAVLYDNPHALLLCHYKRATALCHRDNAAHAPQLDHCVPGCGNIVRTDGQTVALRDRAELLDRRATHTPTPVAERLHATATRLREYADRHDRTRLTLKDPRA
ncbi:hypothetical protein Q0Z83_111950 [Actinoplanes sichuanensis]|uniref:Integrase n=1 Tax=Actinoplanes sichuanensis TaxID=512349 RepID=A0ABW4A1F4_9ACTN|nr:hypothetical protein [Actinoplanes sichuanensis]BEL13004.1 hypothetical protein Q0Z83_111950 [Actinoplanes sichuanensis]